MKVLIVLALIAVTAVAGQGHNEYVDDALIQRVGQIIYEYDQKQAVSRGGNSNVQNSYQQPQPAMTRGGSAGHQWGQPEKVSRVADFDYNQKMPQQYQQPQMPVRKQRQFNAAPQPVTRNIQHQQQPMMRSAPQQQYQAPAPYAYQEPKTVQKSSGGFSGYSLSQPEVVPRVAEFHFNGNEETRDFD